MRQRGCMMNTSLNIANQIPEGLLELYQIIDKHATALGIQYLVVGATARDIVLVHGYNSKVERGTRDIDFGIQVQTWDQFNQLKTRLLEAGFGQHRDRVHQLNIVDSAGMPWEIDIVPFGEIAQNTNEIAWPPEQDVVMNVMGFTEAFENALTVRISENLEIKVASPAGMLILKLISWMERVPEIRKKDATDIYYLVKHYAKIPEILDALYEQDFMEIHNYEELYASTMKLAKDVKSIASTDTLAFINHQLFSDKPREDKLVFDISRGGNIAYEEADKLLEIIKQQFRKTD